MRCVRPVICLAVVAAFWIAGSRLPAQQAASPFRSAPASGTASWEQRVLRTGPAVAPAVLGAARHPVQSSGGNLWAPSRQVTYTTGRYLQEEEYLGQPNNEMLVEPIPRPDPTPHPHRAYDSHAPWPAAGADCAGCGDYPFEPGCGGCGEVVYGEPPCFGVGCFAGGWFEDFSAFAGVHGFKGPLDLGRNGNFGFHEGFNWGLPLGGPENVGVQFGFMATHSNFSGDQVVGFRESDRNQIFLTTGAFRRPPCGGLQGGVVYDYFHDNYYYGKLDLNQLRAELSYAQPGCEEIGVLASVGSASADVVIGGEELTVETTQLYQFFYRRYFESGGDGRIWFGFSGHGDGLIGGELMVPISDRWALANRFNYLIPKEPRGIEGQPEESWSVAMQLVWFPRGSARCASSSPFRPLFSVADNALMMFDLRDGP